MTHLVIDKKKYVLLPEKEYQALQKKQPLKQNRPKFSRWQKVKNLLITSLINGQKESKDS
jgi:hypothetical protein